MTYFERKESMKTKDKLTVTDASIKQVSIEVKVIKIDNRQMTLSVFRQVQKESIIDDATGKLNGKPWGRVEYHTANCDIYQSLRMGKHIHVLWQKGNELRQCNIVEGKCSKSVYDYFAAL